MADFRTAPEQFVHFLDLMSTVRFFTDYKTRSIDLLGLATGGSALDVGCGTGEDVRAMAERVGPAGRIVGVDVDGMLVETARVRSGGSPETTFIRADARELPFDDCSFECCRADRVLVHIEDTMRALAEMTRVCRPGGTIMITEPDYGTLVIDSPKEELTESIVRCYRDSFPAPTAARSLARLFRQAGLVEISVSTDTFIVTDFDLAAEVFELPLMAEQAVSRSLISAVEAREWLAELARMPEDSGMFIAVTGFGVRARKQERGAT